MSGIFFDAKDFEARNAAALTLRELERLLWLSATTSTGDYLAVTPELERELSFGDDAGSDPDEGQGVTRDALTQALALANGNLTKAGERLGLSRHAVRR